jgi:hypothetical protein
LLIWPIVVIQNFCSALNSLLLLASKKTYVLMFINHTVPCTTGSFENGKKIQTLKKNNQAFR